MSQGYQCIWCGAWIPQFGLPHWLFFGFYCSQRCKTMARLAKRAVAQDRAMARAAAQQARQARRQALGLKPWEAETPVGRFVVGFVVALLLVAAILGGLMPEDKQSFGSRFVVSLALGLASGVGTSWAKRVYRLHWPTFLGVFLAFLILSLVAPRN